MKKIWVLALSLFFYVSNVGAVEELSIEELKILANQGDVEAQLFLGVHYSEGDGIEKDYNKARSWYEKAAAQDHTTAQLVLGNMYLVGQGVQVNFQKAKQWFEKVASNANNIEQKRMAQLILGKMYYEGDFGTNDYQKAKYWFEKSAENDEALAKLYLGIMAYKAQGTDTNYKEAKSWFKEAAKENDTVVLKTIASTYEAGQEFVEARKWYEKAAKYGDSEALMKVKSLPEFNRLLRDCIARKDISLAGVENKKKIESIDRALSYASIYRFFVGKDSLVAELVQEEGIDPAYYRKLEEFKNQLNDSDKDYMIKYISHYDKVYSIEKARLKEAKDLNIFDFLNQCIMLESVESESYLDPEFHYSVKRDTFNSFEVSINSCDVKKSVVGKHNSKPKKIDGTRFVVVNASFKNLDNTPKAVNNGYITIRTLDNKLYKYESEDLFMSEFSVSRNRINPLISRNEKILFRIPDDLYGRIEWHPNLSLSGGSLWCGFASP